MTRSGSTVRTSRFTKNEHGRYRPLATGAAAALLVLGVIPTAGVVIAHANTGPAIVPGTLKICKVAGAGFPVGKRVTFSVSPPPLLSAPVLDVPAGPGPGGYCEVEGTQLPGTTVTITEPPTNAPQSSVLAITTNALGSVTTNLAARTIKFKMGTGVTEVTYTDTHPPLGLPGFLEICKNFVSLSGGGPAFYSFKVNGQTYQVPSNGCSSAIQVGGNPGPDLVVTEVGTPGVQMTIGGCSTNPPGKVGSCISAGLGLGGTVGVKRPIGSPISAETILTITNKP